MPFKVSKGDITKIFVDAIVNPTNHRLVGYSGIDGIIHERGGKLLEEACDPLRGKAVPGESVYTKAYNVPCKHIIHTVSPHWTGGINGEAAIIRSCYRSALKIAEELGCRSVAVPLIGAGNNGCPPDVALDNAISSVREHLALYSDMDISLILYEDDLKSMADEKIKDLDDVIEAKAKVSMKGAQLSDLAGDPGKSFVDLLYEFMDKKGIDKPSAVYTKAGITKGAFSKIINGKTKNPSRNTAIAIAMVMRLSLPETEALLASAGYVLSDSSVSDIIIRYYIENGKYDIWKLNVQLFNYGCEPLVDFD